jgi:hypothetical protein
MLYAVTKDLLGLGWDRQPAAVAGEVVVAVAMRHVASEPVDEPADPGSRNAQDAPKVRPPVAGTARRHGTLLVALGRRH